MRSRTRDRHDLRAAALLGRTVAGGLLVVLGVALIPLPGPGLLVVLAGLVVLARDYEWADRLVVRLRAGSERATVAVRRRLSHNSATRGSSAAASKEEQS